MDYERRIQRLSHRSPRTFDAVEEQLTIRPARIDDVGAMRALIVHLAEYERAPEQVHITLEQLSNDGFGPSKVFDCLMAEWEGSVCAMALYYPVYSTWSGKSMYLEDLIVHQDFRGKGIGLALMRKLCEEAIKGKCVKMMWQVLDWNASAIRFYERMGTELDRQWIDCDLNYEAMKALSNG